MPDKGTVFTMKFGCDNCGKEWSLEFHENVRVQRREEIPYIMTQKRIFSGLPSCIIVTYIREKPQRSDVIDCPNCKTYQDVKIIQRIPIEERKTID